MILPPPSCSGTLGSTLGSTLLAADIPTDPIELHTILSKLPYGEENVKLLQSITTEVALQLPCWTSQLRLCLRAPPPGLTNLLLPHVWNKVQQQLIPQGTDNDLLDAVTRIPTLWRQDYMIQHWHLTRFHIVRDSNDLMMLMTTTSKLLRQIMDHLDADYVIQQRSLPIHQHRSVSLPSFSISEGKNTATTTTTTIIMARSPQTVLAEYYETKKKRQREILSSSSSSRTESRKRPLVSPIFVNWVAKQVQENGEDLESTLTMLCRRIGTDRQRLRQVQEQVDNLPLSSMADGLMRLVTDSSSDLELKQGRALLAGLLKLQKVDIVFDPLPQQLILWKQDDGYDLLHILIDIYLESATLPNINSLVVFLWSNRGSHVNSSKSKSKWAAWLPLGPIVPLLQQLLLLHKQHTQDGSAVQDPEEVRSAIDFFLSLKWDQTHLQAAFESLLGPAVAVPTDPAALQRACAEKLHAVATPTSSKRRRPKSTAAHAVIHQMWGSHSPAMTIVSNAQHAFGHQHHAIMDGDHHDDDEDLYDEDHYDYVDEADHRILLL